MNERVRREHQNHHHGIKSFVILWRLPCTFRHHRLHILGFILLRGDASDVLLPGKIRLMFWWHLESSGAVNPGSMDLGSTIHTVHQLCHYERHVGMQGSRSYGLAIRFTRENGKQRWTEPRLAQAQRHSHIVSSGMGDETSRPLMF